MRKQFIVFVIILLGGTFFFSGCPKAKPFEYHSDNEIPEGPGLFSKEKGEFTIYDSNKGNGSASESPSIEETAPTSSATATDHPTLADDPEFKEFQEWKQSQDNPEEYEEFQEWKRWKEYKKWSDSNKKAE